MYETIVSGSRYSGEVERRRGRLLAGSWLDLAGGLDALIASRCCWSLMPFAPPSSAPMATPGSCPAHARFSAISSEVAPGSLSSLAAAFIRRLSLAFNHIVKPPPSQGTGMCGLRFLAYGQI